MYSSMASQVDPVDASKRLEAVLNLDNCVDAKGASGTVTIVANGSIKGVIDLSTASVNMSAVNYIQLLFGAYLDGGHTINIVSVVGGWSIPNIDTVNYLVIGNVWDGPVTLIDTNIQDGILMGARFKITTPTPLVLGSEWSRNGQTGILHVPLFPITPRTSIVVPSSLVMTGDIDLSSATTTMTTQNYILVQLNSYSNGGHDLSIVSAFSGYDTADLRNMTYLKLGNVWDGPVTFIRKTGNINELRITSPTPLNISGTNLTWNTPHNTYASTFVKYFPVTLQRPSFVTLPGMSTGMSLQVSVVTDIYPNNPPVSKTDIPLYLVDATVQVLPIDQSKNPKARDLFNPLCTRYSYRVYISDVPNSTGLTYTLNEGTHFPISTSLESGNFLTEELTPMVSDDAPTQTLSIYSTYLGTTLKQLIYRQSELQVAFEPFIDYNPVTKTGTIFGVGAPILSISLIDRLGHTYTMTNTSVFTRVDDYTYNYTFNIPNSDFSGWMMMARNPIGVTESLNGKFFYALDLLDSFTGDSYTYITGIDYAVIGGRKMLSLKTDDSPTAFTGISVSENGSWKELPSNEFIMSLLSENQLSTQLKLGVVNNRVISTTFPLWMGSMILNLMSTTPYASYQEFIVNKNVTPSLLSLDIIQLDKCKYQMGGFAPLPTVVDLVPSVTTELYNKHLKYTATNVADTRVVNAQEGFFF